MKSKRFLGRRNKNKSAAAAAHMKSSPVQAMALVPGATTSSAVGSVLYVDVVKNVPKVKPPPPPVTPPMEFSILQEDFPALPGSRSNSRTSSIVPDDWTAMISDDDEEQELVESATQLLSNEATDSYDDEANKNIAEVVAYEESDMQISSGPSFGSTSLSASTAEVQYSSSETSNFQGGNHADGNNNGTANVAPVLSIPKTRMSCVPQTNGAPASNAAEQLYVPTTAQQPLAAPSNQQLYVPTTIQQPQAAPPNQQLYVPTTIQQPQAAPPNQQLYVPTTVQQPQAAPPNQQLYVPTTAQEVNMRTSTQNIFGPTAAPELNERFSAQNIFGPTTAAQQLNVPSTIQQMFGPSISQQRIRPPTAQQTFGPSTTQQSYASSSNQQVNASSSNQRLYGPATAQQMFGFCSSEQVKAPRATHQMFGPAISLQAHAPNTAQQLFGPSIFQQTCMPIPTQQLFGPSTSEQAYASTIAAPKTAQDDWRPTNEERYAYRVSNTQLPLTMQQRPMGPGPEQPFNFDASKYYARLRTNREGMPLGGVTFDMVSPNYEQEWARNTAAQGRNMDGNYNKVLGDEFGLVGLAERLSAAQRNPLLMPQVFGHDATRLNVDMHSSGSNMHSSFDGPLQGGRCCPHEEQFDAGFTDYHRTSQLPLNRPRIHEMKDELLFYFFYCYPRDMIQLLASAELVERGWRFNMFERVWLIRQKDNPHYVHRDMFEIGEYNYFNMMQWKILTRFFELHPDHVEATKTKQQLLQEYGYHPLMG